MSDIANLRARLGFIVRAIDAGKYPTPEAAADAILEVVGSIYSPHRAELLAWLVESGVLAQPEGPWDHRWVTCVEGKAVLMEQGGMDRPLYMVDGMP